MPERVPVNHAVRDQLRDVEVCPGHRLREGEVGEAQRRQMHRDALPPILPVEYVHDENRDVDRNARGPVVSTLVQRRGRVDSFGIGMKCPVVPAMRVCLPFLTVRCFHNRGKSKQCTARRTKTRHALKIQKN